MKNHTKKEWATPYLVKHHRDTIDIRGGKTGLQTEPATPNAHS